MSIKTGDPKLDALYTGRKGVVQFVEVPEQLFAAVAGVGAPESEAFADAIKALYAVSYGAHFAVRKALGQAPPVLPLEAQWWLEGDDALERMQQLAVGGDAGSRDEWHWQAMIAQLPPIDEAVLADAVEAARKKNAGPAVDAVELLRFAEGPAAQVLHVGPYANEAVTVATMHAAITAHEARPCGRHHEIYLSDPRRAAPESLRTILRQPFEALVPAS